MRGPGPVCSSGWESPFNHLGSVSPGKSCNLSDPQCPHFKNGNQNSVDVRIFKMETDTGVIYKFHVTREMYV